MELPGSIADVELFHEVFEVAAMFSGVETGCADVEEYEPARTLTALVDLHLPAADQATAIVKDLKWEPRTGCHVNLLFLSS